MLYVRIPKHPRLCEVPFGGARVLSFNAYNAVRHVQVGVVGTHLQFPRGRCSRAIAAFLCLRRTRARTPDGQASGTDSGRRGCGRRGSSRKGTLKAA